MPAWLLAVGALRHYGWAHVPDQLAGIASKGLGGFAILVLLLTVWLQSSRSRALGAVLLWWAYEETQVVVCSAMYSFSPWPVEPGQAICSARAGIELGAFGIMIVAGVCWYLVRLYSVDHSSEQVR